MQRSVTTYRQTVLVLGGMCIWVIIEWSSMKIPHPHNDRLISLHVYGSYYNATVASISILSIKYLDYTLSMIVLWPCIIDPQAYGSFPWNT